MDKRSLRKLDTCHINIRQIITLADKQIPLIVVEGHRSIGRQLYLYTIGRSKVEKGNHNEKPSKAVDVYPDPINWLDTKRMYYLAGTIIAIAKQKRINVRWGGDWDQDTEVLDNRFNDLGHFELAGD